MMSRDSRLHFMGDFRPVPALVTLRMRPPSPATPRPSLPHGAARRPRPRHSRALRPADLTQSPPPPPHLQPPALITARQRDRGEGCGIPHRTLQWRPCPPHPPRIHRPGPGPALPGTVPARRARLDAQRGLHCVPRKKSDNSESDPDRCIPGTIVSRAGPIPVDTQPAGWATLPKGGPLQLILGR